MHAVFILWKILYTRTSKGLYIAINQIMLCYKCRKQNSEENEADKTVLLRFYHMLVQEPSH